MTQSPIDPMDVCAFGAHPDDVELAAGGTLALLTSQEKRVALVDLTRGELGTRGTAETRRSEAANAAAILGVAHRENLDLGDGFFEVNETALMAVVEVLRRLRPSIVIANAKSDRHPDHGRASELVSRACFLSGLSKIKTVDNQSGLAQEAWRPRSVYFTIQDRWREPDFVVDIEGFEEIKARAIMAYATQFYGGVDDNAPVTPISSPDFLDYLKSRDLAMGRLGGVGIGEGFEAERPPVVNDLFHLA
jgi:bacillithiol biosynthesis deacetylase BshB1